MTPKQLWLLNAKIQGWQLIPDSREWMHNPSQPFDTKSVYDFRKCSEQSVRAALVASIMNAAQSDLGSIDYDAQDLTEGMQHLETLTLQELETLYNNITD